MKLIKPSFEVLTKIDGKEILKKIELAGRTCYKSEDKITDDSAEKFVRGIIKNGHESVIEHENISVKFIVDRGVSHELVRHRLCSYSQESTRYCSYKDCVTFIIPCWVNIDEGDYSTDEVLNYDDYWINAMAEAESSYLTLLQIGWSPQQARSVLPNSLKTEIVCTTNLREWRHILKLRTSKAAHPQMREIMIPLFKYFKSIIPIVFDDIIISI